MVRSNRTRQDPGVVGKEDVDATLMEARDGALEVGEAEQVKLVSLVEPDVLRGQVGASGRQQAGRVGAEAGWARRGGSRLTRRVGSGSGMRALKTRGGRARSALRCFAHRICRPQQD